VCGCSCGLSGLAGFPCARAPRAKITRRGLGARRATSSQPWSAGSDVTILRQWTAARSEVVVRWAHGPLEPAGTLRTRYLEFFHCYRGPGKRLF
jgi:hypothetical protein